MTFRHIGILVVVLLPIGQTQGDDTAVYESLPEVSVGKVFFSQTQREQLDKRRGNPTSRSSGVRTGSPQSRRKIDPNAAGYWISSQGLSKVYVAGDFVARNAPAEKRFPGDVSIAQAGVASSDEQGDGEE